MSKRNYGIPYMGSKNRIAKQIIDFLPSGETLVDLFGGGAITDCASESGKWKNIIYNDLDVLPYTCFLKALRGEYENETRWISREDFFKLKDTDEYVACCFSFGNNFRDYMYNEKIEPYKRAYHYAIVLDDFKPLSELFDEETVEMLKKSVEVETDKKQRRLKFTRALGNYIIGLSKEAEVRKTIGVVNSKFPINVLQNQERAERLDTLKKTLQIDKSSRNLLVNQQSKERIELLKKTMHITNNINKGDLSQNNVYKERLDTLKKTMQITDDNNVGNCIEHYPRLQRLQQMYQEQVNNITFFNDDYRNVELPANAIIYCDIPYKQTQKYNTSTSFDYDAFYDWCIEKKKQGYQVFISEYSMPEDKFECVFEMSKITSLAAKKSSRVTEKIFVPK